MVKTRIAKAQDSQEFKRLWKTCFGDSDEFIDWFFSNRFVPEYCVCLEQDSEIISCMQGYPYHVNVRGKVVFGAMLAGVCTHPDHRKKGHMKTIFAFMMDMLYKKGVVLAAHTPAVLESYFSYGHLPVSDAWYLTAKTIPQLNSNADICHLDISDNSLGGVFDCYVRNLSQYSGSISRTMADFSLKANDYAADGAKCLALNENGKVVGYCFYYQTNEQVEAVEVVADNLQCYERLLHGLCVYYPKLAFKAKLPPDKKVTLYFATGKLEQKGVMGGVNLPKLLGIVCGQKGYAIAIKDWVIKGNCNVFNLLGEAVSDTADVEIDAAGLTQLLVGYRTLTQLHDTGCAVFINEQKAVEMDKLLKPMPCYIIDEY